MPERTVAARLRALWQKPPQSEFDRLAKAHFPDVVAALEALLGAADPIARRGKHAGLIAACEAAEQRLRELAEALPKEEE